MDEIMSFEDLCKYLKLAKSTAYKLSRRKDFPSSIIGRQLRFRKSKVDQWIDEQEKRRQHRSAVQKTNTPSWSSFAKDAPEQKKRLKKNQFAMT